MLAGRAAAAAASTAAAAAAAAAAFDSFVSGTIFEGDLPLLGDIFAFRAAVECEGAY
jgi:hypothetical protein